MPRQRILLFALCLTLISACWRTSSAQVSVYGTIAITAYGVSNSNTYFYDKSGDPGFVIGAFYNFPINSRLTAGLDVRLTNSPGAKGGTAGALAFRVGFVPHKVRLRPYFELGGGVVHTMTDVELVTDGAPPGRYTNGASMLAAGLDVRVTRSFDIRVLELGAEAGGNSDVAYAGAGVVYQFGHH